MTSPPSEQTWEALAAAVFGATDPVVPLRLHQHSRWNSGERPAIEEYRQRFPQLNDEDVLVLILGEIKLRASRGERADLAEYQSRFPDLAGDLAIQFQMFSEMSLREEGTTLAASHPPGSIPFVRHELPGYILGDEIGHGGMGIVYRATDTLLKRDVAVKILHDHYPPDGSAASRFLEEARITSQLQHPGIPPIHLIGSIADGRPFLTMKLIKGSTLARRLADGISTLGELTAIFEHVCQAVAYAHAHKVIHRDLKPANVMVGAFGEVQVMDWGLAKLLNAAGETTVEATRLEVKRTLTEIRSLREPDSATVTGSILGTLSFMPPEQAGGENERVDERADVFGLGAVLCQILTGQPPYVGPDSDTVRLMAIRGDLAGAFDRLAACAAAPEWVTLCRHCLAVDPEARFRNAGEVATAVARLREAAEERARQADLDRVRAEGDTKAAGLQVVEERKRRKVTLALVTSFGLLVVASAAFLWWQGRQETLQRAERERKERQVREAVPPLLELGADLRNQHRYAEGAKTLDRAEVLLSEGEADDLKGGLEQARSDLAFARELDEIYSRSMNLVTLEDKRVEFDRISPPPLYRAAFLARGFDFAGDPEKLAAKLQASGIRQQLIDSLDFWSIHEPDESLSKRILAVLSRADPGPWLNRLRDPEVRADRIRLAELVKDAKPETLPAIQLRILSRLAVERGIDSAPLLLESHRSHPADFTLNYNLGVWCRNNDRAADAVGYLRAARAVRPTNAAVLAELANALRAAGDREGALATCREAIRHDRTTNSHSVMSRLLADSDLPTLLATCRESNRLFPDDPGLRFSYAYALQRSGRHNDAVDVLKEGIRRSPALYPGMQLQIVRTLVDGGDLARAKAACEELFLRYPNDPSYPLEWGNLLLAAKRWEETEAAFREVLKSKPSDVSALIGLSESLKSNGEADNALAALQKAIDEQPRNAWLFHRVAAARRSKGDWIGALAAMRQAVDLEPDVAAHHHRLITTMHDKGDVDAAMDLAVKTLPRFSEDSNLLSYLGWNLCKLRGDYTNGLRYLRTVVRIHKNDAMAHNNLARCLADSGSYEEAKVSLRDALKIDANFAVAHHNLGVVFRQQGNWNESITAFEDAIRCDPNGADHPNMLAYTLRLSGRVDEAVERLRQDSARLPKAASLKRHLGWTLCKDKRQFDEGIALLHEAVLLEPDFAQNHFELAEGLLEAGRYGEASVFLEEAGRRYRGYLHDIFTLGTNRLATGEWDAAIAAHRAYAAVDPKNPYTLNDRGVAHFKRAGGFQEKDERRLEDLRAAESLFRSAVALKSDYAFARGNLGNVLLLQGKRESALSEYEAATRFDKSTPWIQQGLAEARQAVQDHIAPPPRPR